MFVSEKRGQECAENTAQCVGEGSVQAEERGWKLDEPAFGGVGIGIRSSSAAQPSELEQQQEQKD